MFREPRSSSGLATGISGHDPSRTAPKILIVLHQENSSPGRVGHLLQAAGFRLDIRRPPLGDRLPETLEEHAGAVIFGGPMSANDPDEFVRHETEWLAVPLREEKPFLGICLGAQMLANHLGASVAPHPAGQVEIGWYPLRATGEGRALMQEWPEMVYHFHREGFELPRSATLLATGDVYPNQAFRYGSHAWGLQFHAELTQAMMHRWVVRGAQHGRLHLEGRMIHDAALKAWLVAFLTRIFGTADSTAAHCI